MLKLASKNYYWKRAAKKALSVVTAAATIANTTAGTVTSPVHIDNAAMAEQLLQQQMAAMAIPAEKELGRRLTFREFVDLVRPGYQWYRHCVSLADVLQKVADGELKRVMIFMPPRHGKSELASRLFSAYFLYMYPNRWVAVVSYGQGLANTLSRAAKGNYTSCGRTLSKGARAVKQWETGFGGGMWCAGIRGEMTGKGWHLGIVDDPLKDGLQAESETIRDAMRDNYQSAFLSREEPNEKGEKDGAIIIINTRWHEEDLSGWLLRQERSDDEEDHEHWHIVSFPAIAEEPERDDNGNIVSAYPPTCSVEPDWRQPGEALCPERRPIEKLRRILRKVGDYFWNALYQQRPRSRDGGMFQRAWFQKVPRLPMTRLEKGREVAVQYTYVRYWDKAGTEGGGAYTAGVLLALADTGEIYVVDVVRGQWSAKRREDKILETAHADEKKYGDNVVIWIEEEGGSGGKESAENTLKRPLCLAIMCGER